MEKSSQQAHTKWHEKSSKMVSGKKQKRTLLFEFPIESLQEKANGKCGPAGVRLLASLILVCRAAPRNLWDGQSVAYAVGFPVQLVSILSKREDLRPVATQ